MYIYICVFMCIHSFSFWLNKQSLDKRANTTASNKFAIQCNCSTQIIISKINQQFLILYLPLSRCFLLSYPLSRSLICWFFIAFSRHDFDENVFKTMKKCTKKFWIKLEDFFLQFSFLWHSRISTATKCQQSFIRSVMLKTISNENEFIIPRCDHKINFVLSYILFYSKDICWKKKRICLNTILMKFYVLRKCSEKKTEERERESLSLSKVNMRKMKSFF